LGVQYPPRQVQGLALALAMNYAFDFEEMNKQIFFSQYKRIAELLSKAPS
jgi:ABC-type oligopeptide transport system substrate-binding subunit